MQTSGHFRSCVRDDESYPSPAAMFARVTTFQGEPDSVDGPMRFPLRKASQGLEELPGFLAIFDLADRKSGRAAVLTLWARKDSRG